MKSDPKMVDSFLDRLGLKPVSEPKPPPQAEATRRATRTAPLVMRMDGWQIAGNVVIVPEASVSVLEQVLKAPPPPNQGPLPGNLSQEV